MGMGDELMALGDARKLMRSDPRRVRILDRNGTPRWHPLWEGSERVARPDEQGDFQQFTNGPGVRPYHAGKDDRRWRFNVDYRPTPAEVNLRPEEIEFGARYADRIIVEPLIKPAASPNKQWGRENWERLVKLGAEHGLRFARLGPLGLERHALPGVEFIATNSFRLACAVMSRARAAVLPEGGMHHAAAAFGVPAVVIFGGFIPVQTTGYDMHVNLGASFDEACGMRVPCEHCRKWMKRIKPDAVFDELRKILGC